MLKNNMGVKVEYYYNKKKLEALILSWFQSSRKKLTKIFSNKKNE
jgi:hypothetical protein